MSAHRSSWLTDWDPPEMSAWVEDEFGRGIFANAWEAYSGGLVVDVHSQADHAEHTMRQTLHLFEGLRVEPRELVVDRPRRAIKFHVSGGGILFPTAAHLHYGGLKGMRPTRVDAGPFLDHDYVEYLRSRGTEVWTGGRVLG